MKTYKGLSKKIFTLENFRKAYKNAIKGKKHYKEVKLIERRGPVKYLRELLKEVVDKTYEVSEYEIFKRFTGHKWREIYKLPMRDRIVQHAIMNYLEPIFRETFILDTYSSIKYRGIHLGLSRVKKALRTGDYNYCLKLDIHKCYPSLDKEILKNKLAKKFKDDDLLWLLFKIVDSCEHGIPIGNYTSQYFNNFYFSDFDHWIKEVKGIKAYFRYCDDIVILAKTKEELEALLKEIFIEIEKLNVRLKDNWQIFPIEDRGISFLGYVIRHKYVRVRKNTRINFVTKTTKIDFNHLSPKDVNVLGSYWGILKHADCRHLWFKYTGVKTFKDLNVSVHDRDFVKDLIDIPLVITNSWIYQKKGTDWLKFECSYETRNKKDEVIKHENVLVSTSGEVLVEAGKQFTAASYPFETVIIVNDKGYYQFT